MRSCKVLLSIVANLNFFFLEIFENGNIIYALYGEAVVIAIETLGFGIGFLYEGYKTYLFLKKSNIPKKHEVRKKNIKDNF